MRSRDDYENGRDNGAGGNANWPANDTLQSHAAPPLIVPVVRGRSVGVVADAGQPAVVTRLDRSCVQGAREERARPAERGRLSYSVNCPARASEAPEPYAARSARQRLRVGNTTDGRHARGRAPAPIRPARSRGSTWSKCRQRTPTRGRE